MKPDAHLRLLASCTGLILILVALALFFGGHENPATAGPGGPGSTTHFKQTTTVRNCESFRPLSGTRPTVCVVETLGAGAPYDSTLNFQIPWGHLNFSQVVAFFAPDSILAPSSLLPLGAPVGWLRSATTLGLLNAPCTPGPSAMYTLEVNFTFMNGTTDKSLTMDPLPLTAAGSEGTLEVYGDDINGNGLPDNVDFYPSFNNKVFDPDRVGDINGDGDEADTVSEAAGAGSGETALGLDLNGDTDTLDAFDINGDGDTLDSVVENGPLAALTPFARYTAFTLVAGTAILLQFVVFEPGQLSAAYGVSLPTHPFADLVPEMGYPVIVVLTDPTQSLSPSAIGDFCSPLATWTVTTGLTRDNPCTPAIGPSGTNASNDGVGCNNSNAMCPTTVGPPCGNNAAIITPEVCADGTDDDADTLVNDGCTNVGAAEAACADAIDQDGDLYVNDGCIASGAAEPLCGDCVNGVESPTLSGLYTGALRTSAAPAGVAPDESLDPDGAGPKTNVRLANPPAGTGIHGSGTHLYLNYSQSFRDADADGLENFFDTCPAIGPNTDDPRVTAGTDADMIDPVCDPTATNTGAGNHDDDRTGVPLNDWSNAQDICPLNHNVTQRESDLNMPYSLAAPNGGPRADQFGDACEGYEFGAQCLNMVSDDDDNGDTVITAADRVNDGCVARGGTGGPSSAESGAACANATNEDAADDALDGGGAFINDGCPVVDGSLRAVRGNGHFHIYLEVVPKCIISAGVTDSDGDGYCDGLETALCGAACVSNAGNPGNQTDDVTPPGVDVLECYSCGTGAEGSGGIGNGDPSAGTGPECDNATDDDGDGKVNDGCPASAGAEFAQFCENTSNDDADLFVNDGCFPADRGNCADGKDNDTDGVTDAADAGCLTPESHALSFPLTLSNRGGGLDADIDGIPDNDEVANGGTGAAFDEATASAPGQQEEPHQVCNNDIDEDGDGTMDAFANASNTVGPQPGGAAAEPGGACGSHLGADDTDLDGLGTAADNCDSVYNPGQKNTDSDAEGVGTGGDACDTDDDNDGTSDIDEWKCGSRALSLASEISPPCPFSPKVVNPSVNNPLGSGAPGDPELIKHDRDGDGWTLGEEINIGTEPPGSLIDDDPCGNNGWPGDLLDDATVPSTQVSKVDIGDLASFLFPPRGADDGHGTFNKFNHPLDDTPPFGVSIDAAMARWNLDIAGGAPPPGGHTPTTAINIGDLGAINPAVLALTARPPMFAREPAFFAGNCPFPE